MKEDKNNPFKLEDLVQVVCATDETLSTQFIGLKGKIVYFDYTCGCGQSYPNDPMIGVVFSNSTVEEFWREEIVCIS